MEEDGQSGTVIFLVAERLEDVARSSDIFVRVTEMVTGRGNESDVKTSFISAVLTTLFSLNLEGRNVFTEVAKANFATCALVAVCITL